MIQKSYYESDDFMFNHRCLEAPSDFPLHIHDVYELIYLKKGDISYMVEGKIYKPVKNCLILTRPMENHAIIIDSPGHYERYAILVDEKRLLSDIYKKISPNTVMLNFDSNPLISDIFRKMDYYFELFEGDELKTLLLHLTEEVLYNFASASQNAVQNAIYITNPVIQEVLAYIDRNINTPLNMDTICKELFISRSYLYSLFMKHLRLTPQKYILSKKLAIAQRELRLGHKATEVYIGCGFSDYTTFFRAYKKNFGHAPSEEINTNIIRKIQS